jgi:uncharacterized membrane protein YfcA
MDLIIIGLTACLVSALTLFSGFGLGTILMPVFALFFPVSLAIAATAFVHFANNLFKFGLMARQADWQVVARFSIPAVLTAIAGAALLSVFDRLPILYRYTIDNMIFEITMIKVVIGSLICVFAMLELSPRFQNLTLPSRWLPLGGALSGFFGGLSGNQGAFRSAFLLRAGLSKEGFVATGIVSAVLVDITRLTVYGVGFLADQLSATRELIAPVVVGSVCAFIGALAGKRILQKITLCSVQRVVAAMMIIIGGGLVLGLI